MQNRNILIGGTMIAVAGIAGASFLFLQNSDNKTETKTSNDVAATQAPSANVTTAPMNFKDGKYSANGDYISPGGREEVLVGVTLKDNVIEDVTFEGKADNPTSQSWQKKFADNYKQTVVGKKIDQVKLDKVSGSSLTSVGFNNALGKIVTSAKE